MQVRPANKQMNPICCNALYYAIKEQKTLITGKMTVNKLLKKTKARKKLTMIEKQSSTEEAEPLRSSAMTVHRTKR